MTFPEEMSFLVSSIFTQRFTFIVSMKKLSFLFLTLTFTFTSFAQQTFPRNGVKDTREKYYALTHANIFTDYQTMIKEATIIIRDGKIEAVGQNISIPKGAVEINVRGKYIYPSFIDIHSDSGIPEVKP